jgi:hypothetical protein
MQVFILLRGGAVARRPKRLHAHFAVILVVLLGVGCSSLQQDSSPRSISSKPPESAIVLTAPVTVRDQTATDTFPAGKYRPLYEDRGGYYFEAPAKVLVDDVAVFAYDGGLYVARGAAAPTRWYVSRPNGKTMGRFKKIPPHTLVP